jgi:tetratricopeptide (TPR) repeat protein
MPRLRHEAAAGSRAVLASPGRAPGTRALGWRGASSRIATCAGIAAALFALASLARAGDVPGVQIVPVEPVSARLQGLLAELDRDHAAPRAFVPLVELSDLEDELPDLAPAALAYARLAEDREAHPEVRAYARFRLASLERSRGNLRRSEAELEKLEFLSGWQVAGPFDNEGKRGFDDVFPPEREQDLAARFPGKAREVGWRPLPAEVISMGFADLGAAVRPAREVVVYALTVLDAPREERVRLHLGTSGAVKVFVNGALVHADPTYHVARLDQSVVAFTLRKGHNRLLLKLCHAQGQLGFYARLADGRGEPVHRAATGVPPLPPPQAPALRASAARPAYAKPCRAGACPPPAERHAPVCSRPVEKCLRLLSQGGALPAGRGGASPGYSVLAVLERRAAEARGPAAAQAHGDLAIALAERRPGEDRERRAADEARRAVELAPRSVSARFLAARLDEDGNRRRVQLEAAVEAHPDDALALTALARHELQRGRLARAKRLLDRAIAASPRYVAARLAQADLQEQAGLAARARAQREATARTDPFHPGAVAAAARSARAQGRPDQAARLLRKALALRFDDASARAMLVQVLLEQADLEGAVQLIQEALRLDPADRMARLRLADLLAANGRSDEAEAAFEVALRIAPDEAEILERRGRARLRAGRTKDALADFQAALELKPQNPQLKELVRALEPARERFEKPYLYDALELARTAPPPEPEDDAFVLGDLKVTKVFPSGLSSTFTQVVVRVVTQRGVDAWRTWSAGYSADRQELRVERARIVKPDGEVVESYQESDHSASEPWYRLYYDTRRRTLGFPALTPGDLLEIAVRTDDVASENLLADYFGDLVFLGDGKRKARADYVLLVPGGRPIFASEPALPNISRSERRLPDGVVERHWAARDVARIRPEPGMPGWSEVAPYVHVSTYESWADVGRFYWRLIREQLAVTPEIRDAAGRIASEVRAERRAKGQPEAGDALALVQAVHRFVVTNIRYVGLEFGIHGYKPYRVDQVLERRFGDCKDKASLAHALLEALGIDSRLVLLRMRRLGRIPERPASLAVFNHAILYVPRYDLWLDGTASYSGSHDLPGEDRGATVLVVNPSDPARFTTVPEGRPEDNVSASRYDVALAADGSALVNGQARVAGVHAPGYRRAYAAEHDRRARLEQAMSRAFPGLTVQSVSVSDLGRLEDEVSMRFSMALPRLAEREDGQLRFLPFGGGHRYAESLAPLSSRRFDLVVGEPWETRLTYQYTLPKGFAAVELPAPVRLDATFAAFDASCREEGGAVKAEARIAMKKGLVTAAEYPAFREFLSQVDRALARPVRVGPPVTSPTVAR